MLAGDALATGSRCSNAASFPITDNITAASALGAVVGATDWGLEAVLSIPEIDIKVDSIAVTAQTKKLKAKWTPELGQDLNAYHNLDAEVELTRFSRSKLLLRLIARSLLTS